MVENLKELKDIKNLYRLLIFSVIFQIIPSFGLQIFGAILFMVVLFWAYFLKTKYVDDPFGKSHAVHVIKTIWNFSSFFVIGLVIGSIIFYIKADQSTLTAYTDQIMSTGAVSEAEMESVMKQTIKDNLGLVIKIGLVTLGPSVLYLIARIWSGYGSAGYERRM
ncbi:MAG: hypothetical protein JKY11_02045 [Alphaproteobacteria bacterium]|nr:hypothetical protein [Alphaproteobacteria bacterium]